MQYKRINIRGGKSFSFFKLFANTNKHIQLLFYGICRRNYFFKHFTNYQAYTLHTAGYIGWQEAPPEGFLSVRCCVGSPHSLGKPCRRTL